jgi:predicted nucleic-acid-binding protein
MVLKISKSLLTFIISLALCTCFVPTFQATSAYAASTFPATDLELGQTKLELEVGEQWQFFAYIAPYTAGNNERTWTTSDASIVSIDSNGKAIANKVGEATITVQVDALTATCNIKVFEPVENQASITTKDGAVSEYKTLEEAFAKAQEDDTVKLLKTYGKVDDGDNKTYTDITLPDGISFDLNGKALCSTHILIDSETTVKEISNGIIYSGDKAGANITRMMHVKGTLSKFSDVEITGATINSGTTQRATHWSLLYVNGGGIIKQVQNCKFKGSVQCILIESPGIINEIDSCYIYTSSLPSYEYSYQSIGTTGIDIHDYAMVDGKYAQIGTVSNCKIISTGNYNQCYGVYLEGNQASIAHIKDNNIEAVIPVDASTSSKATIDSGYFKTRSAYDQDFECSLQTLRSAKITIKGGFYSSPKMNSNDGKISFSYGYRLSSEPNADGWYEVKKIDASGSGVAPGSILSDGSCVAKGGIYYLSQSSNGTITVATQEAVQIVGPGIDTEIDGGLTIECAVIGADLCIQDMFIDSGETNVINFYGKGNTLRFSGTNILEQQLLWYSCIHVPEDGSLDIEATDSRASLYIYKYSQGAGIGGDPAEVNGEITFNGGKIFAKGSKQGALIGGGANSSASKDATPGDITINAGELNLMSVSRGACIGGSAGSSGGQAGGKFYINGGTTTINIDFSGAAIGGGGYADGNDSDGGTLYYRGGSLRTFVDKNAVVSDNNVNLWENFGITGMGVWSEVITADKLNSEGEKVYLCKLNTLLLDESANIYAVKDGNDIIYSGSLHRYHYINETLQKDEQLKIDNTLTNWTSLYDPNIYIYLTGEDHVLDLNGQEIKATWNGETKSFDMPQVEGGDEDEDIQAASVVSDLIAALPAEADVTLDDEVNVNNVYSHFNNLTNKQKSYVSQESTNKLTGLVAAIDRLCAQQVESVIKALPTYKKATLENKDDIESAQQAYNSLTSAQQEYVTSSSILKLNDLINKMVDLQAAKNVTILIEALPQSSEVSLNDKSAIQSAKEAFDNLDETQKGFISDENNKKLQDCIAVLEQLEEQKNKQDAEKNNSWSQDTKTNVSTKAKIGKIYKVSGASYKIISSTSIMLVKAANKNKVTYNVVKILGKKYKVTAVGTKAFKSSKRAKQVTFGSNVKTFKSKAFAASRLINITVKSKKLTRLSVKSSLKLSKIKFIKIKVSNSKRVNNKHLKKYKKIFTKNNCGKKIRVL